MINHIIISLLILLVGCSTSQKEYDINNINYRYDGYIKKFSDEKVNGKVFQMIDDIQVPLGKMKNGTKDGLWTSWFKSGQKHIEETFKDGEKDGLFTLWHSNRQKKIEGTFKDGEQNGLWTYWDKNGQMMYYGTFKDGAHQVRDTIKYDFVCGGVQRRWLSE